MIFLFKKKEIFIDAFTTHKEVHDFFPIDHAVKFMPDWWKKIPKNQETENSFVGSTPSMSMRHCSGIIDYYRNGFIMPLWSDIKLKIGFDSVTYQFAADHHKIESHGEKQHNNSFQNYHHIKFCCPWHLKTKSDVQFLCTMPTWNLRQFWDKIQILPGVMDFKFNSGLNVNTFFKKDDYSVLLEAGTPLYYISPLTDKQIKIKNHLVSESEIASKIYGNPFFTNKRMKMKKFLKGGE
jgi:hypothetical protein